MASLAKLQLESAGAASRWARISAGQKKKPPLAAAAAAAALASRDRAEFADFLSFARSFDESSSKKGERKERLLGSLERLAS